MRGALAALVLGSLPARLAKPHAFTRRPSDVAMDPELSREFDTGVEQDEIMARAGTYSIGTLPGTTWKALVIIGSVTLIVGLAFEILSRSSVYPIGDYWPTPLGPLLIVVVLVAGVLILLAGIGLAVADRRDPPIEPIV